MWARTSVFGALGALQPADAISLIWRRISSVCAGSPIEAARAPTARPSKRGPGCSGGPATGQDEGPVGSGCAAAAGGAGVLLAGCCADGFRQGEGSGAAWCRGELALHAAAGGAGSLPNPAGAPHCVAGVLPAVRAACKTSALTLVHAGGQDHPEGKQVDVSEKPAL